MRLTIFNASVTKLVLLEKQAMDAGAYYTAARITLEIASRIAAGSRGNARNIS